MGAQVYLVTFVTRDRKPFFSNAFSARIACRSLTDPRAWQHSRLLAWVLMPDHWHGLIELGQTEALSAIVGRLKANSARNMRLAYPALDGIWARAFHDRALRSEESLLVAARYVIQNPIRAGLVTSLRQYPYWDAIWL